MAERNEENKTCPPVKLGQVLELECISIGKKGDGVFKHESFIIIANYAKVGIKYKLKITKVFPTIAFADIEDKK